MTPRRTVATARPNACVRMSVCELSMPLGNTSRFQRESPHREKPPIVPEYPVRLEPIPGKLPLLQCVHYSTDQIILDQACDSMSKVLLSFAVACCRRGLAVPLSSECGIRSMLRTEHRPSLSRKKAYAWHSARNETKIRGSSRTKRRGRPNQGFWSGRGYWR